MDENYGFSKHVLKLSRSYSKNRISANQYYFGSSKQKRLHKEFHNVLQMKFNYSIYSLKILYTVCRKTEFKNNRTNLT